MDFGQLGCHATAERVTEVSHPRAIDTECNSQMVIGRAGVKLRARISGTPVERHVTTIFGEENGESGMTLDSPCPFELPYGKVGVSMEAEQNSRRGSGIPDHETGESLPVYSVVRDTSGLGQGFKQPGRLKQDSLLRPPKQRQRPDQQGEKDKRGDHMRVSRGFQWVCMAGNLRQCEFR
jgi:hypothetical protein